jgi:hypothetical protein
MSHDLPTVGLVELDGSRARWRLANANVELDLGVPIRHFLVDYDSNRIAFLCGETAEQQRFLGRTVTFFISVYDLHGPFICRFDEPNDVHFNCLGANRDCALAVMATTYKSGWCDWWYGLNVDTGELVSLGEGR